MTSGAAGAHGTLILSRSDVERLPALDFRRRERFAFNA